MATSPYRGSSRSAQVLNVSVTLVPEDRHRRELQRRLIEAALEYLSYMGSNALLVAIPGTSPKVMIAAGDEKRIRELLPKVGAKPVD